MSTLMKWTALLGLTFFCEFVPAAKADSLIFENHTGNAYHYDLTLDYINSGFTFNNQPIYQPDFVSLQITGLSGVTGVSVSGDLTTYLKLTCTYTATEVDCVKTGGLVVIIGPLGPITIGDLSIMSLANPGSVAYSVVDTGPDTPGSSGSVLGPIAGTTTVAPTPEPSTLLLLGTGMAAAAGASRRRLFGK